MTAPPSPLQASTPWLSIVGIGEDGWDGLSVAAKDTIAAAELLIGGERHLALVPQRPQQARRPWPSPFAAAYAQVRAARGRPVCVLASGDPMCYGIGSRLAAEYPPDEWRILPAVSSLSLAAARLGWALQETRVIPAHGRALTRLNLYLAPGARLLVLSADADTPARIAALLCARGFGPSRLIVLERLGGPDERRREALAADWQEVPGAALNLVGIECRGPGNARLSRRAGLPDSAFEHDGQLTKRDVRAATLARLAPQPGELLWDVGAGCGSIGIEWMRAEASSQAIAIESHPARQALIQRNSKALGVPELRLVAGRAPEALAELPAPDAIFIGGGLTCAGVTEHCWQALRPGGRLVANAVTLQSETALVALRTELGGELTRLSVSQATPLGGFDAWRPAFPITLLTIEKPGPAAEQCRE
ncbi:precorrin-6y C5,15-methyltransferase (decarboxylating) subunit CbiE [Rhabdochromatium marinum]|uniref:precorrin-6y C5,15-methyltransferase (decarboxylating) subunit CbiE n=1 Tax=Rhabdochromatium marinum TaxID=48729 RepID=UPI001904F14E|nr:precorrin-6y C5,15-methyltransferase (decarboxylating) subunit CbiE [Rhabdochromatium marinum]MBK1647843.1 cobalamin biosynthesis bifunctional protein CbiET [Rhabdochromatium marinum]